MSISSKNGLTIKRRRSRRHPPEHLPDLDYADDIALLEDYIQAAQDLLHSVELACQNVGLFLNAAKLSLYMHLNPSSDNKLFSTDGTEIERVDDFK